MEGCSALDTFLYREYIVQSSVISWCNVVSLGLQFIYWDDISAWRYVVGFPQTRISFFNLLKGVLIFLVLRFGRGRCTGRCLISYARSWLILFYFFKAMMENEKLIHKNKGAFQSLWELQWTKDKICFHVWKMKQRNRMHWWTSSYSHSPTKYHLYWK